MSITYHLGHAPLDSVTIGQFQTLSKLLFERENDDEEALWRINNMPDFTSFEAKVDGQLIAYKMGYAHTGARYYSWLGGVHPDFRAQGIAKALMQRQHQWLIARGYEKVETRARQNNHAMARLNLESGFAAVGIRYTDGTPNIIYEKKLT